MKERIDQIRSLIEKDHIKEALIKFKELLRHNPLYEEILLLSVRFNGLRKQVRGGLLMSEETTIWENRIRKALIDILTEFENELNEKGEITDNDQQTLDNSSKMVNLGRELFFTNSEINKEDRVKKLSGTLIKISEILNSKINSLEKKEGIEGDYGRLNFYTDNIPEILIDFKGMIPNSLAENIETALNEITNIKGKFVFEAKDEHLEKLIKDLKIASSYFKETADFIKMI